ncbi:Hypothetical protein A7982_11527 [Minicystis rosea]|nr:Hypothetical protein A7982_11527 [Minicystis rosea]
MDMRLLILPIVASFALAACSGGDSNDTSSTGAGGTGTGGATTSSSTGTGGTGTTTSTGTGGQTPGDGPIVAPDETWTWIPFDNAFCGDGSTTGIGVNLTKKSSRVLIYLEGGGACWNELTCTTFKTASNFTTGFGESSFKSTASGQLAGGFFDRGDATNPFKDYSVVYVPYCTGDIHAGDNTVMYAGKPAKHTGFANMTAFLERIVPTFPSADRVILSGVSAGGFGAALNWDQTQKAFGNIRVDLIDDSGTPMPPEIPIAAEDAWRTQWNLAKTLPAGCTECAQHLDALLGYYGKTYPDHRAALISYTKDTVLTTFFSISQDTFNTGLETEITTYFDPQPNFHSFVYDGAGHVLWYSPTLATKGVTVKEFITKMVTDDQTWASAHP